MPRLPRSGLRRWLGNGRRGMTMADTLAPHLPVAHPTVAGRRHRLRWSQVALYVALTLIALAMLTPLYWALLSAVRPQEVVFQHVRPVSWRTFVPQELTLQYFGEVLTRTRFPRALANSLFISLTTVVAGLVVNSLAGFGFAKFAFRGKGLLFVVVLLTFMMPFEAIVIPLYMLIRQLGWVDSYLALIVPAIPHGLSIFLFRQFFAEFPNDLLDAARIDGASWWRIYWRIVAPLSTPAFISAALMLFIMQWDAFFWPLVAANSAAHTVVQVEISRFVMQESTSWGRLFAATAMAIGVPMTLFFGLQRYYVQGMTATGLRA
jgi:ABC-type glycerol-3-phosphate transport system permease component